MLACFQTRPYYSLKGFRLCIVDTRGRNYINSKEKNLFSYMTLKNNHFSIFFSFFPYNSKNKASNKNGFQIRILHRKIHQLKEKNILFYMTLNDNNTKLATKLIRVIIKMKAFFGLLNYFGVLNFSIIWAN